MSVFSPATAPSRVPLPSLQDCDLTSLGVEQVEPTIVKSRLLPLQLWETTLCSISVPTACPSQGLSPSSLPLVLSALGL